MGASIVMRQVFRFFAVEGPMFSAETQRSPLVTEHIARGAKAVVARIRDRFLPRDWHPGWGAGIEDPPSWQEATKNHWRFGLAQPGIQQDSCEQSAAAMWRYLDHKQRNVMHKAVTLLGESSEAFSEHMRAAEIRRQAADDAWELQNAIRPSEPAPAKPLPKVPTKRAVKAKPPTGRAKGGDKPKSR